MTISEEEPFHIRGLLIMLTAWGTIHYDGQQELTITIGFDKDFAGLSNLVNNFTQGIGFPESTNFPDFSIFPLPHLDLGHMVRAERQPGAAGAADERS